MTLHGDRKAPLKPPQVISAMGAPVRAQIIDPQLDYGRVLDAMKRQLSSGRDAKTSTDESISDPTIALADAWATALDVLGFYQERMVNESYIATAVEDRSIFELARMTGYGPDQGLAAKCYLSYSIDENMMRDVLIPARSKVRAIPRANEEPQIFETSKDLRARASWNSIKIATSTDFAIEDSSSTFYLRGTTTGLRIGDLLWVDRDKRSSYYLVQSVDVDRDTDSTATSVVLRSMPDPNFGKKTDVATPELFSEKEQTEIDRQSSDAYYQMQTAGRAWIEENTIMAMARLSEAKAKEKPVEVTGFRKRARLFGHSAPRRLENPLDPKSESVPWNLDEEDKSRTDVVDLEGHHPTILQNAELCLEIPDRSVHGEDLEIYEILSVKLMSRTAYGTTGDITRLKLNRPWKSAHWTERYEEVVQKVIVHLDEVKLPLGRVPITSIGESKEPGAAGGPPSSAENTIELAGVYLGIEPGRRMILSGDPPKEEVPEDDREPELVEVKSVSHPPYPFGNAAARERRAEPTGTRTILEFVELRHRYDPKKVKLSGNVVEATHGETYTEILGSGIGGREYQSFALARGPVTHLPATKFPGAKPELSVTVDGEEWTNVDTLARRVDGNRGFGLWTDETSKARVYFGNGEAGARLPTGRENVRASYRIGLGQSGNIARDRLKLPVDHPLGVQEVSNTRAFGGSDREPIGRVRANTTAATVALSRLVTTADFLAMTRVYPGVAKAAVRTLTVRNHAAVVVSILRDDLTSPKSDAELCATLRSAMLRHQDGTASVFVVPGIVSPIAIGASMRVRPGASWDEVSGAVRAALIEVFGFECRDLNQPAHPSEALAAIQSIKAVDFATLTRFDRYTPGPSAEGVTSPRIEVSRPVDGAGKILGSELLLLQPSLPNSIVLEQDRS